MHIGTAVHVLIQHFYKAGTLLTSVVEVVAVRVEVLGHLPNEDTVRVLAAGPATHVGLTTLIGKEEKVILKEVMPLHWLETERERQRERERERERERDRERERERERE